MGMGPEQLGALTIAELEKAAERVSAALAVLREAGAWRPEVSPPTPETPVSTPIQVPRPVSVRPVLSAGERAERARLMQQFAPETDEDGS